MKNVNIELFDEYPFYAYTARVEYRKALQPVHERGRRVFNDIIRVIKSNAALGEITVIMTKLNSDNEIEYCAKPITFRERWSKYWSGSDGHRVVMNSADLDFVINTIRDCGYGVSPPRTQGNLLYIDISWNDI